MSHEILMVVSKKMSNNAVMPQNSTARIVLIMMVIEYHNDMNSMKLVIPLHFISYKKIPNDAVTPQRQGQFTPKMKANAVPRLLSSLV